MNLIIGRKSDLQMKLFDTFPTLEFNEEMMDILADVDVLKVATNSAKTRLRVYIVSKRLIPKHIIFTLSLVALPMWLLYEVSIWIVKRTVR